MNARSKTVIGGSTIEYVDTGGNGSVVVLLDGTLMDEHLWREVLARLTRQHRCVIPVLPMGAASIHMPAVVAVSPSCQADFVAQLTSDLGLKDLTLVGARSARR